MKVVNLTLKPKHNLPLAKGFKIYAYLKEKKTKSRKKIGYVLRKTGLNCTIKILEEYKDSILDLNFTIDTHVVDRCTRMVGLVFCK